MTVPVLVIATNNRHKVREFETGLSGLGFHILPLARFPGGPEVEEDGSTFTANALKKARAAFAFTGYPSLADDSGLEVAALLGAPGVQSHRFAGPQGDDGANNALLIKKLKGLPPKQRQARFRAVLALVWGPGQELTVDGTCSGIVLEIPRGSGGFGYDSLFYLPELNRTMAELPLEQKNEISHRGQAISKLRSILTTKNFLTNKSK
jgi:XTP/dITP diphosphohydrolase